MNVFGVRASREEKAQRGKAVRHFAAFHGRREDQISVDEVENSPMGLTGWAETVPHQTFELILHMLVSE